MNGTPFEAIYLPCLLSFPVGCLDLADNGSTGDYQHHRSDFPPTRMTSSVIDAPSASPHVARAITTARKLIAGATSENTRRSYGWRQFTAHARALGLELLGAHPALVATFLGICATGGPRLKPSGRRRRRSGSFIGQQA